jgi:meiotically up-regulated gene 157 (Mug157) protein
MFTLASAFANLHDATRYFVPANAFAVVELEGTAAMLRALNVGPQVSERVFCGLLRLREHALSSI